MKRKKRESEEIGGVSEDVRDASTKDDVKFKTLFELVNDIIVYVDGHGKILNVNGKV